MAWDADNNHSAAIPGANIEFGTATLAVNTIEVPTRLSKLISAQACHQAAPGAGVQLVCDLVITAGAVTIADAGVAAGAISYEFFGLP
ncbi:MAG TPA: hypothetical protein VMY35_12205 [Phycisphaerae bacterium]|nr:hypothetical protein [Phycisphaerae bacterium]